MEGCATARGRKTFAPHGSAKPATRATSGPPLDHQTAPYLEVLKNYGGVSVLRIYGINNYQYDPKEGGFKNLGAAREDGKLMERVLGPTFSDVQARYDEDVTVANIQRDLKDLVKSTSASIPRRTRRRP